MNASSLVNEPATSSKRCLVEFGSTASAWDSVETRRPFEVSL
jgi:hypothetical protein